MSTIPPTIQTLEGIKKFLKDFYDQETDKEVSKNISDTIDLIEKMLERKRTEAQVEIIQQEMDESFSDQELPAQFHKEDLD